MSVLRESLGEAIHTAFRKASDHPTAHTAWRAIDNMPAEDWDAIIEFIDDGLAPLLPDTTHFPDA